MSDKGWKVVTYKDIEGESEDNTTEEKVGEEEPKKVKKESRPLIWGDLNSRAFWKRNIFPVLFQAAFLILVLNCNPSDGIYIHFFFYLVLFCYYLITKSFTFRNLRRNMSSGSRFWTTSMGCSLVFALTIGATVALTFISPKLKLGMYPLIHTSTIDVVIFAITTMFLAPIVEETFYRGNMINLESKKLRAVTTVASILLFAILHSYSWWGILCAAIWAIPLTLTFIKTRNVYVTMVAHFFVSLLINIPIMISFLQ